MELTRALERLPPSFHTWRCRSFPPRLLLGPSSSPQKELSEPGCSQTAPALFQSHPDSHISKQGSQTLCIKWEYYFKKLMGTSLVVQWSRIRLAVRGHRSSAIWSGQDPVPRDAIEPVLSSPGTVTTEACAPRAHALQQEKPLHKKHVSQQRIAPLTATRESPAHSQKTQHRQKEANIYIFFKLMSPPSNLSVFNKKFNKTI